MKILIRSTQKVKSNYQSAKIFKTVCDRQSRGRVFIPYWWLSDVLKNPVAHTGFGPG